MVDRLWMLGRRLSLPPAYVEILVKAMPLSRLPQGRSTGAEGSAVGLASAPFADPAISGCCMEYGVMEAIPRREAWFHIWHPTSRRLLFWTPTREGPALLKPILGTLESHQDEAVSCTDAEPELSTKVGEHEPPA